MAVPSVRVLRERLEIGQEIHPAADGKQNRNRAGAYGDPNASRSHNGILATRTRTRKAGNSATYDAGSKLGSVATQRWEHHLPVVQILRLLLDPGQDDPTTNPHPTDGPSWTSLTGMASGSHHLVMSRRRLALSAVGLAVVTTACTGQPADKPSATQPARTSVGCGTVGVRASVGSAAVVLQLPSATITARVGDTLELSAFGACHSSVKLYERGDLIAMGKLRVQLGQIGKRVFAAAIPDCTDLSPPCFGPQHELGSVEVTTRG